MEHFNYNLQKVLDFKIEIEEKKKEEFVKALKRYLKQEKLLKDLLIKKEETEKKIESIRTGFDCLTYSRYLESLNDRIETEKNNLKKAEGLLQSAKGELIKSTSDRKVLEKLKEKAKAEFEFEVSKKEQKQNDDFALFSYIRSERR